MTAQKEKISWDFKFHEPFLTVYINCDNLITMAPWKAWSKIPKTVFKKQLTYLAFLVTFDLTYKLKTVPCINFSPCYSFYSPISQGTSTQFSGVFLKNRVLLVAEYLE